MASEQHHLAKLLTSVALAQDRKACWGHWRVSPDANGESTGKPTRDPSGIRNQPVSDLNHPIDAEVSSGLPVVSEWENKFYRDSTLNAKGKTTT